MKHGSPYVETVENTES